MFLPDNCHIFTFDQLIADLWIFKRLSVFVGFDWIN